MTHTVIAKGNQASKPASKYFFSPPRAILITYWLWQPAPARHWRWPLQMQQGLTRGREQQPQWSHQRPLVQRPHRWREREQARRPYVPARPGNP